MDLCTSLTRASWSWELSDVLGATCNEGLGQGRAMLTRNPHEQARLGPVKAQAARRCLCMAQANQEARQAFVAVMTRLKPLALCLPTGAAGAPASHACASSRGSWPSEEGRAGG